MPLYLNAATRRRVADSVADQTGGATERPARIVNVTPSFPLPRTCEYGMCGFSVEQSATAMLVTVRHWGDMKAEMVIDTALFKMPRTNPPPYDRYNEILLEAMKRLSLNCHKDDQTVEDSLPLKERR